MIDPKRTTPSILCYWHDMWIPHSQYFVAALRSWDNVGALTICGPAHRHGAASIYTVSESLPTDTPCGADEIRTKSYWWMETTTTFQEWRKLIRERRPEILVICDEALSLNVLLAGIANRLYGNGVVLFYGFENLVQKPNWKELVANPTFGVLRKTIRKLIKATIIDRLFMPLRRRVVHGGLVSYEKCADVVRSYHWNPLMETHWWPVNELAFTPSGPKKDFSLCAQFIIGFVGRFVPEKGILDLLKAVATLDKHIGVVLIGAGPQEAEIRRELDRLQISDRALILPPQGPYSLATCYRAINLLVLPSRSTPNWEEQYGRVLMEARLCGTPVAGSNSGAIPVVVGNSKLIFPEGDIGGIAEIIQRAAIMPRPVACISQVANLKSFLNAWLALANRCRQANASVLLETDR